MIDLFKNVFFRSKEGPELSPMSDMDVKQPDATAALFDRLLTILHDYNMAKEVPKNRGAWIDEINSWMGVEMGSPYCLSGILYCLKTLEEATGARFDLPKLPSTQRFWEAVKAEYKREHPSPWSIGIMRSTKNPSLGHAVLVVSYEAMDGNFRTFEFNTDISGTRDGDGAMFTSRHYSGTGDLKFLGFIPLEKTILKS